MKKLSKFFNLHYSIFTFGLILVFFSYTSSIHTQCEGNVTINSQSLVDSFNCTSFTGNLYISGSDITNLNGLSELALVEGDLYISGNAALTNIDGLAALTSVWVLGIRNNAALTRIDGLAALTSVWVLAISDNAALTSIDGLAALTSVGGLVISGNAALTNIDGLAALTSGGEFWIYNNAALTNIDGLAALTSGGDLWIDNNAVLMRCCGLYPLLMYGEVDSITIDNNATGCTYNDILYGGICPDINTLIIYFDARVSDDMIEGSGNKPLKRIEKFRKLLESANRFFEENETEAYCNKLMQSYNFSDGTERAFIEGEAVSNLSAMTEELMMNAYCY